MSPPRNPPLSSATLAGDWKVTRRETAGVNPASGSTWHLVAGGTDVPPAEPSPLLGHAGRRLEGDAPGDGRSKSGLRLHLAFSRGGDRCPPRGTLPSPRPRWQAIGR